MNVVSCGRSVSGEDCSEGQPGAEAGSETGQTGADRPQHPAGAERQGETGDQGGHRCETDQASTHSLHMQNSFCLILLLLFD